MDPYYLFRRIENSSEIGLTPPTEWLTDTVEFLTDHYRANLDLHQQKIEVYARVYSNEILLIVSLAPFMEDQGLPLTCFISLDVEEKQETPSLDRLIDLSGFFFDYCFSEEEIEYDPNWQKEKLQNLEFFYRFTRENISLTLQANELLREH